MSLITVEVDGTPRSVKVRGFKIHERLLRRSTVSLTINDPDSALALRGGHPITIKDNAGDPFFSGHIADGVDLKPTVAKVSQEWKASVVDYHYRVDKRQAAAVYEGISAGAIVADLIANFADGEGLTAVVGTGQVLQVETGEQASTPHHATFNPAGVLSLRASFAGGFKRRPLEDTYPISKWGTAGGRHFRLVVRTTGRLGIEVSTDGTDTVSRTSSVRIPHGATNIRVDIDPTTGTATFYAGQDYITALGAADTGSTFTIYTGSTVALSTLMAGYLEEVIVMDGATEVANPDWTDAAEWPDVTPHADAAGRTWTVVGADLAAATVHPGALVNLAKFGYVGVARAIDRMAEASNAWWRIDVDGLLHFQPRAAFSAPWILTGPDINDWRRVKVKHGSLRYRNRQYVRGGTAYTDTQVEEFTSDGEQRTFNVGYPIEYVPTIEIDTGSGYVAASVGIRGLDTGKDMYWSKGDKEVSMDLADTPLNADEMVKVTYVGSYPLITLAEDEAEIAIRAAREGTTGIVEHTISDTVEGLGAGFDRAAALLGTYSNEGRILRFRTFRSGLEVGQLLTVDIPEIGFDGADSLLIEEVIIRSTAGGTALHWDVKCTEGPATGGWVKFFTEATDALDDLVVIDNIAESEVLGLLHSVDEAWSWGETVTPTVRACPITSPSTLTSGSLLTC